MARLTRLSPDGTHPVVSTDAVTPSAAGYEGAAIDRLAAYEDLLEAILADQAYITAALAGLRAEGKAKTVQSRELLARKLTNASLLAMFEARGLRA